ncbi:hypothetical protein [Microtetraspora sp. NBRC 16547]|uniref:hypothetical protein n=1 Tax=Microtetraspora sp. NBRC 16547 TaxID=3030993 RepID=UPI0025544F38|nr:hypothetical protein [Microtetraspora sp. NBRC 16547]
MAPLRRKSIEERIAERQAQRGALEGKGKHFEHGPAKFIFVFLIVFVVLGHLLGLILLMMLDIT